MTFPGLKEASASYAFSEICSQARLRGTCRECWTSVVVGWICRRNGEAAAALAPVCSAGKAFREFANSTPMTWPSGGGEIKASHRDLFCRNRSSDEEVPRHPPFPDCLWYFVAGPKLPAMLRDHLRRAVRCLRTGLTKWLPPSCKVPLFLRNTVFIPAGGRPAREWLGSKLPPINYPRGLDLQCHNDRLPLNCSAHAPSRHSFQESRQKMARLRERFGCPASLHSHPEAF